MLDISLPSNFLKLLSLDLKVLAAAAAGVLLVEDSTIEDDKANSPVLSAISSISTSCLEIFCFWSSSPVSVSDLA